MRPVRLGAVSYLNTKPLVHGLEARPDLFSVRFDVPAVCATLLHQGGVDVGLIPAIEYGRRAYEIVPDVAIGSNGPIASVALFSRVSIAKVQSIALDISSNTSVALTRILCAKRWGIRPRFRPGVPDLTIMLSQADAALLIGDPALAIDADAFGALKIDLGSEWLALTGLPFVYAVWAGRAGALSAEHVRELQSSRDRGVCDIETIARSAAGGDATRAARALVYLRDNLKYGLGSAERAGLSRFHELAAELGVGPAKRSLRFYE
ncbi:MAG: menaquinone biosynthesis protein [Acidobacteria bacterium]|nr:menaquinone biosynthesis protein [Acidobacteriota bacterium]